MQAVDCQTIHDESWTKVISPSTPDATICEETAPTICKKKSSCKEKVVIACEEKVSCKVPKEACKEKVVTGCESEGIAHYDPYTDGVPPNSATDVLVVTSGVVRESADMFFQRARRNDMRFIYVCIIILNILFLLSAIFGVNSDWYRGLQKDGVNPYVIGSLWVIAAIMAYGSLFMLWEHIGPEELARDVRISVYFLIGTFLSVLWAGVFFQGHDLRWSMWLAAILFLYQFWLLIYIWLIKPTAGIFLLPLVVLYGYFFYASIRTAFLNHTSI